MSPNWLFQLFLLIPVIVHLFSFKRAKAQLFSTLKFVKKVNIESKSRSRLKHILILSTRFLAFFSIILFILFFEKDHSVNEIHPNAYLVDNTPSMSIKHNGQQPLELIDEVLPLKEETDNELLMINSSIHTYLDLINQYPNLISDFQGFTPDQLSFYLKDTSRYYHLYLVGDVNKYKNVFIDTLTVNYKVDDFSKRRITLFPSRSNALIEGDIIYRLFHKKRQLASVVQNINDFDKVVFDISWELSGDFMVEIEGDEVYFDNEFRFVIHVQQKPIISLIDASNNVYLQSVFDNKDLFDLRIMDPNLVDYEFINSSDLIILNNLENMPSGLRTQISNKSMIIFPPLAKSSYFESIGFNTSTITDTSFYELEIVFENPLFKGLLVNNGELVEMPRSRSLYKLNGDFESIITLRNGDPLLIKLANRDHYFFNTYLSEQYTDLPTNAIFLPLLYKLALFSTPNKFANYLYPDDLVQVTSKNKEMPPKLTAEEFEVIPEFTPNANGITYKIPRLNPGFYTLLLDKDSTRIGVNMSREESIMEATTIEELESHFENQKNVAIQSFSSLQNGMAKEEFSVWKYALILTICLLIVETLFHKYLR